MAVLAFHLSFCVLAGGGKASVHYRYLIGILFEILFEFMTLKPSHSRLLRVFFFFPFFGVAH